ncbi:MAG: PEP-CTERM sorting domain-containing protein [Akkermansia sp.]
MNITRPILSLACSLLLAPALFAEGFIKNDWILNNATIESDGCLITKTDTFTDASFAWNQKDKGDFSFVKGDVVKINFSLNTTHGEADSSTIKFTLGKSQGAIKTTIDIVTFRNKNDNALMWKVSFGGVYGEEYRYGNGDITLSLENQGDGKVFISVGEGWKSYETHTYEKWKVDTNPEVNIESNDADTITFKSFEKTKAVPEPTTVVLSLIGMMGLCARRRRVA